VHIGMRDGTRKLLFGHVGDVLRPSELMRFHRLEKTAFTTDLKDAYASNSGFAIY
jgi:hypothetical protein